MCDGGLPGSSQALFLEEGCKARVDSDDGGENLENAQNQRIGLRIGDSLVNRPPPARFEVSTGGQMRPNS